MTSMFESNTFTEFDYDFSDVKSRIELEACRLYEYARESRAAISEIASLRQQQSDGKPRQMKFGLRVQNLIQSHILMSLSFASGFPKTPWRCLPDKDRQIILRYIASIPAVWRYATTWHNPPLTFALNEPGTFTLDMWRKQRRDRLPSIPDSDSIKTGFFAVNMKYGHAVLIEEFTKYLRHFEGKPMLESPLVAREHVKSKPPGRKSIYDALNALGAMRLRYYCHTFSQADKRMQVLRSKPHGMFYGRRGNFNRACNAAVRHFEGVFGWLDTGKPIHFTAGWTGLRNKNLISEPTQK